MSLRMQLFGSQESEFGDGGRWRRALKLTLKQGCCVHFQRYQYKPIKDFQIWSKNTSFCFCCFTKQQTVLKQRYHEFHSSAFNSQLHGADIHDIARQLSSRPLPSIPFKVKSCIYISAAMQTLLMVQFKFFYDRTGIYFGVTQR